GFSGSGGGDRGYQPNVTSYPESANYAIVRKSANPPGQQGQQVELLANHFKINVGSVLVYQHDLNIDFANENDRNYFNADNDKKQKYFAKHSYAIFQEFVLANEKFFNFHYIYDRSKNLYSSKPLNTTGLKNTVEVQIEGRRKQFQIALNMVQKIDMTHIEHYYKMSTSDLPEVMRHFLELMFQYCYTHRFYLHQRSFFDTDPNRLMRGPLQWVQFANGFSHGVCLTEMGLSLNIHLKTSCLISVSVDELSKLVTLVSGGRDPSQFGPGDIVMVNKIIRGLKIFTTHTGHKTCYTIKELIIRKPSDIKFTMKNNEADNRSISIHDYFSEKYKIRLSNYPLVRTVGKEQYIPLELCKMVDKQFLNNSKIQADPNIPNELLRVSTHKPLVYFDKLTKITNQIPSLSPEIMSEFKTEFSPKPIRFFGRVLNAPQ
ncbi:hypothetical protein BLA29_005454, partial [Euroglyphus maynei]